MCLAIPMQIVEIDGLVGVCDVGGIARKVRLDLLPEVTLGDFVLVHAGLAISRLDADEAEETLALLRRMADEVQP